MKTPGSSQRLARRHRSPRKLPPVTGLTGSQATRAAGSPPERSRRMTSLRRELFPAPGGPVKPTRRARGAPAARRWAPAVRWAALIARPSTEGSRRRNSSRPDVRLPARLRPEEAPRDDEALDLARALVDLGDLRIPVISLHREVLQVPGSTMDLDGLRRGAVRSLRGVKLRHRGLPRVRHAGIAHRRGLPHEEARHLEVEPHARDLPLDGLEVGDGLPELPPLLRVPDGVFEAGGDDAGRLGRDADPASVQGVHGEPEAAPHRGEHSVRGDLDVLEDDLDRLRAADPELLLVLPDVDARRLGIDEERRDPLRAKGAVHRRED